MSEGRTATEKDWGDIENLPPPRRGLPRWLLGCGGCLVIAVIALAVGGYFLANFWKRTSDPDIQYPALERYIGLDGRLQNYNLLGLDFGGKKVFAFLSQDTKQIWILRVGDDEETRQLLDQMFDSEQGAASQVPGAPSELERGTLRVQGRDLEVLRGLQARGELNPMQQAMQASIALLEITPPEASVRLLLIAAHNQDQERITDEELLDFLAPFHVGPERPLPEPSPTTVPPTEESR